MSLKTRVSIGIGLAVIGVIVLTGRSQTSMLDFRGSKVPARLEIAGLDQAAPTVQGLHIKSMKEGRLAATLELPHRADGVSLTTVTGRHMDAIFSWHVRGTPEDRMVRLPFTMTKGDPSVTKLYTGWYLEWDPYTDRISLTFPAGVDIVLQDVRFHQWSIARRAWEGVRTFWTFDDMRPYSINFVWGPLLSFSPFGREQLFHNMPPLSYSANHLFYAILGLAVLVTALRVRRGPAKERRAHLRRLLIVAAALWLVYDLRMGLEFLGYAKEDYRTYWSETRERRTFRERKHFYDFIGAVRPLLEGQDRYIFLASERWPYLGLSRYLTYPSLPTTPENLSELDSWVVYERPDVTLGPDGRLMAEGKAISPPGKMHEFEPGTFFFTVTR